VQSAKLVFAPAVARKTPHARNPARNVLELNRRRYCRELALMEKFVRILGLSASN
jgi:hypothetical protein